MCQEPEHDLAVMLSSGSQVAAVKVLPGLRFYLETRLGEHPPQSSLGLLAESLPCGCTTEGPAFC